MCASRIVACSPHSICICRSQAGACVRRLLAAHIYRCTSQAGACVRYGRLLATMRRSDGCLAAPLAPLGQNDMWTGARASTRPAPDPPREAEAIEAARLRASGHAHLHHTIAHVARATTRRLDGVKAPLTVVGDAYKNNVLRFRKLWRRDPAAPALCLDDPQALLVIRRP